MKLETDIKIPKTYRVEKISAKLGKEYIHKNHYSHGSHNGPFPCYGLFDVDTLIGVLMFSTPCSENVRRSIYGDNRKDEVIELSRLHILDITPRNTESWFIGKCLKLLKRDRPITTCVISFADPTEGHSGVIYKATGFKFDGYSSPATFYRDKDGRLRHPRQNGKNIKRSDAMLFGWTVEKRLGKIRYLKYI